MITGVAVDGMEKLHAAHVQLYDSTAAAELLSNEPLPSKMRELLVDCMKERPLRMTATTAPCITFTVTTAEPMVIMQEKTLVLVRVGELLIQLCS